MTTYQLAKQYTNLGISVIPLLPRSKQPNFDRLLLTGYKRYDSARGREVGAWEEAQRHLPDDRTLAAWFEGEAGVAMIGGKVSNDLLYLDFDTPDGYRAWALGHKALVNSTAVQKTVRGYHVFLHTPAPKGGKLYCGGSPVGEARGEGMYVACAPSIHPTGTPYRWLRPPDQGIATVGSLAEIDLALTAAPEGRADRAASRPMYVGLGDSRLGKWAEAQVKALAPWRAEDYDAWLKVGMSLSGLGEEGRRLWHEFSARSTKYDPEVVDKKWQTFDPGDGLTPASLAYWAKQDNGCNVCDRKAPRWQTI